MRTLKIGEAADILGVSHSTLRAWEQRFDYPTARRTPGRHREYLYEEIVALRDALRAGLSVSSAVSQARGALTADASVLIGSMLSYDIDRADATMEASLAMRSMERSVEEVLLPSLSRIARNPGTESTAWSLAALWAEDWLRRARRMAQAPSPNATVMIGDAAIEPLSFETLLVRAFELFCVRSGVRTVTVPVTRAVGLSGSVAAFTPKVFIVAGSAAADLDVARWVLNARESAPNVPLKAFHRVFRADTARTVSTLSEAPYQAHREVVAALEMVARSPRRAALDDMIDEVTA